VNKDYEFLAADVSPPRIVSRGLATSCFKCETWERHRKQTIMFGKDS